MEKGNEISFLLPFLLSRTEKQKMDTAGMRYIVSKNGMILSINGTLPKILFAKNNFYVYQIDPNTTTVEITKERGAFVKAIPDKENLQGEYDSHIISLMFRDLVIAGIIFAFAFFFLPGLANFVRKTIREMSPSLVKIGSYIEIMDNGWIKERIHYIPKENIVAYRKQIRYNRFGRKHYFVFVKDKNGKWYLYEIIHPPEELYKFKKELNKFKGGEQL